MKANGFIGPSYYLRSATIECQRCVNFLMEVDEIGTGKEASQAFYTTTPGLQLLATMTDGPIRGIFTLSNGLLAVVAGKIFYTVDSSWVATERGHLLTNSGIVSIADSGVEACIVDGLNGYIYSLDSETFSVIISSGWHPADQVVFTDGYFVFNESGTGRFFYSALYDGKTIDPLDFNTASGNPDPIISLVMLRKELWELGSQTIEVSVNTGDTDIPFQRIPGALIEFGCGAVHSVCVVDNSVFWLGGGKNGVGTVWRNNGYTPVRISTHALEATLQDYGDLSGAYAWSYHQDGHQFYCLTVPGTNTTWCFDVATGLWHERTYTNPNSGKQEQHRANCHAFFNNKHVVGDYENGNLYSLEPLVYTDNGAPITRHRAWIHITNGMKRVFHDKLEVIGFMGVGLDGASTTYGNDPKIMMQFSNDGGFTWSNEAWTTMGKIGNFINRAVWRRLGMARDRVYRITVTDPVPVILQGADIDMRGGVS